MTTSWSTANIPDQTGRTAIITGANSGIGRAAAHALAAAGARVVLAVRDTDKGQSAAASMPARPRSAGLTW
jgi:NAD(P)-dependent dehydrogenase (short-subunit alcohol dehydrogenase family)